MGKKNLVGKNIKKLRQIKGLTQESLAFKCGLSQGYIGHLECGVRGYTQKSLELIAKALDVEIIELFKTNNAENEGIYCAQTISYTDSKGSHINEIGADQRSGPAYTQEFITLLEELPHHITEHYLTLLQMEKKILKEKNLQKKQRTMTNKSI